MNKALSIASLSVTPGLCCNFLLNNYNFLQGLEIYLDEKSNISDFYLALRNSAERDNLYKMMIQQPKIKLVALQQDVMTLQWQNGVISNYDYLLYLNRYSNLLLNLSIFVWEIYL